jgi:hypothetical protein
MDTIYLKKHTVALSVNSKNSEIGIRMGEFGSKLYLGRITKNGDLCESPFAFAF